MATLASARAAHRDAAMTSSRPSPWRSFDPAGTPNRRVLTIEKSVPFRCYISLLATPGKGVPMTAEDLDHADEAASTAEAPPRLWVPADGGITADEQAALHSGMSRRTLIRIGAVGAAGVAFTAGRAVAEPYLAQQGVLSSDGVFAAAATALADLVYIEAFPTSPLILKPFTDPLNVPKALRPVPESELETWSQRPNAGAGQQNGYRGTDRGLQVEQRDPSDLAEPDRLSGPDRLQDRPSGPDPLVHHVPGSADRPEGQADGLVRRDGQDLPGRHPADSARSARSTASTAPSRGRGSTPSTANRSSSGSTTTSTRTRWAWTGRISAPTTIPP